MAMRIGYVPFKVPDTYWKENKDLSYNEAAILYLHDVKCLSITKIAQALNRERTTISTQYTRIIHKRK